MLTFILMVVHGNLDVGNVREIILKNITEIYGILRKKSYYVILELYYETSNLIRIRNVIM